MEKITLEQIDLIMQRANVSYSEAKESLEQCGGDTVEALLLLEKAEKIKTQSTASTNTNHANASEAREQFKGFLAKLHATNFILRKDDQVYIDVPLTIAIIALVFCCYVSITALVIALIFGIKVEIKGQNPVADKLNSTIDFLKK